MKIILNYNFYFILVAKFWWLWINNFLNACSVLDLLSKYVFVQTENYLTFNLQTTMFFWLLILCLSIHKSVMITLIRFLGLPVTTFVEWKVYMSNIIVFAFGPIENWKSCSRESICEKLLHIINHTMMYVCMYCMYIVYWPIYIAP